MPKVLGQTGTSLADSYDVEGSIAGIENLDTGTVQVVHEMGGVQFSERFAERIVEGATAALAQNVAFVVEMSSLPDVPMIRVLGLMVTVDTAARVLNCAVSPTDEVNGRECPIWVFDTANTDAVRFFIGAALANQNSLRPFPEYTRLPYLLSGTTQREPVPSLNLRGTTSGFGAGTVTVTLSAHIAFPQVEGLSSKGLPIPGW